MTLECKEMVDETIKEINTRFGKIYVSTEKVISFNEGLLGIPFKEFALANFPDNDHFKILQSLENEELSFMVLPIYSGDKDLVMHNLIAREDIAKSSEMFELSQEDVLMMLIVTIHNEIDTTKSRISVNVKAPIIVDVKNALGFQHVFTSKKYSIRHFIT